MTAWIELALVFLTAAVLLYYTGYGLTKLVIPAELAGYEALIAPFTGLGFIAILSYYAVNTFFNLTWALAVILLVATLANGYALWRRPRGLRLDIPAEAGLGLLVIVIFAVGSLPLLRHGYLTVIGESWDVEFYLPLAEYLKTLPQTMIGQAPPNPAIRLLTIPPTSGRAMGLTYFHSIISLIIGQEAITTFAPVLSFAHGLSALAVYVFARRILRLGRTGGLLVASLVGLSEPFLWLVFNSFAMHVGSFGLLPLLLVATEVVLRKRDWRSIVFAAFLFAAVAVTYHPALTAFALLGLTMGVWVLLEEKQKAPVLRAAGTALGLGLGLSFLTHLRFADGFLGPYSDRVTSLGIRSFAPVSELYGLSFFFPQGQGRSSWLDLEALFRGQQNAIATVATAAALALSVVGLWWLRSRGNGLTLALAAASAVYLLVFRLLTNSQYGFFKGATFLGFILWGLVTAGLVALWSSDRPRFRLAGKGVSIVLAASLSALLIFNTTLLVGQYWDRDLPLYGSDTREVSEIAALIAPGASVYVTGDPALPKAYLGLVSYYLEQHPLYGTYSTGFSLLQNPPPERPPDYALLTEGIDPSTLGYRESEMVYAGTRLRLYRAQTGVLAHYQPDREEASPSFSDVKPLVIGVEPQGLVLEGQPSASKPQAERAVTLGLATFTPQRVLISAGSRVTTVELQPGVTEVDTGALSAPIELSLSAQGQGEVFLRYASLRAAETEPSARQRSNAILMSSATSFDDSLATTQLNLTTPSFGDGSQIVRLKAAIAGRLATTREPVEGGAWEFWASTAADINIKTDLESGSFQVAAGDHPLESHGQGRPLPDGSYGLSISLIRQDSVVMSRQVLIFDVRDGHAVKTEPDDFVLALAYLPTPQREADAKYGDLIGLKGYTLDRPAYRAGQTAGLTLYWQGLEPIERDYTVSARLVDSAGQVAAVSEGPPAAGRYRTSAWPSGEIVQDRREVSLPADLAPGEYRLEVGLRDGVSGNWLSVAPGGDRASLGSIRVER